MFAHTQPVPKKGNRSNPLDYRPIALTSCVSTPFESILNRKILKHLSADNLLCDHQYGFRKGRSSADLLSSLGVSLKLLLLPLTDISKAFDRVWHKSYLTNYPLAVSVLFFVPLSQVSFFVLSIVTVVDDHCSSVKPVNSGVSQGSILSLPLFLFFINDLLSLTECPIHACANDSTLSTRHILPDKYRLFFSNTQLSPTSTSNILGLSFTKTLNWNFTFHLLLN